MPEEKEFSDKEIALDNIEMWMSEQETLHLIREVLSMAFDSGFKAGQKEGWSSLKWLWMLSKKSLLD